MPRTTYLALGDDITAGAGVFHPSLGFVKYVSDYLHAGSFVKQTAVVAKPNWTSKELFQAARLLEPQHWQSARVVTVCVGMTDFSGLSVPRRLTLNGSPFPHSSVLRGFDEFGGYTERLFQMIDDQGIPHVIVTTVFNPFPLYKPSGHFVEAMNHIIRDCALGHGFSVVDVDRRFAGNEARLIQGYGKGAGHNLIGQLVNLTAPALPISRIKDASLIRLPSARYALVAPHRQQSDEFCLTSKAGRAAYHQPANPQRT